MRRPVVLFIVAALSIIGGTAAYVVFAAKGAQQDIDQRTAQAQARVDDFAPDPGVVESPTPVPESLAFAEEDSILQAGDVAFINRVPGDTYTNVGIRRADGRREIFDRQCDRMHVQGSIGLCLKGPHDLGRYDMDLLDFTDPTLPVLEHDSGVLPSRARVSGDRQWASATMFASGTSYQDVGGFATFVTITDLRPTGDPTLRLARYSLNQTQDSHSVFPDNRNYWGVTWGEDGTFWVTAGSEDTVELLLGSAEKRELWTTGLAGSCPSLSPDGDLLVYKRTRPEGGFDLVARRLFTAEEWLVGETRSVDDQVEWLDNDTILYALHAEGTDPATTTQPEFDIWSIDIAPGSTPRLFLPNADSPAAQ